MFWVEKQALPWYDAVSEDTRTGNDKGNKVFVSAVGVALWNKFKNEVRKKNHEISATVRLSYDISEMHQ
jgi:hypothetical protein